jgi:DNA end-binding protein Ku
MAKLKASINFGLVHIPVEMVLAEDRRREASFHMLDSKDHGRIRYKRVNEKTGREVEWEDIVKGMEVEKDKYVIFTDEDFKALEAESNRNLQIDVFVDKDEISPLYFETPYYLIPGKGGERAYAILQKALAESKKYGVVQAVLRNKQQLGVIFSQDDALIFELIRYADELKDAGEILSASAAQTKVSEKEIAMAERLIGDMTAKFQPDAYKDTYAEKLQDAIQKKLRGKKIITSKEREQAPPQKSVDIMELLQKSLATKVQKRGKGKRAA